ncbi:MAG TPA: hypothetical protein VFE47_24640 [Tepidisphaeraceae bacterium]|jgi:hypothetical protein|nr:hypothetical protein [Tepidisphaeraceae bacterium]
MKNKDPALWAACRVHRILAQAHCRAVDNSLPSLSTLLIEQKALERGWRMYQKARAHQWPYVEAILRRRILSDIQQVHAASRAIPPSRIAEIPTILEILAEIRQLQDEFDDVEIDVRERRIAVTTDAITLEDVPLGEFCIQLHLDRLAKRRDASAFIIVAEDANAASSDSSCTHPHVRDEALCAGDGSAPISHALAEGRIGDAFQLINRVLHTYNPSSAYVSLDAWDGRSCTDCGRTISSDDLYYCDSCSEEYCDNCIRTCADCEESVCLNCLKEDADGNQLCPTCFAASQKKREEGGDEVEEDPILDPTEDEPQPQTEIFHEYPHCPQTHAGGAELPRGPSDSQDRAASADASSPQAA